jgi:hypothetical protein
MERSAREAPGRHCEERSDEAIQRARSAPTKKARAVAATSALICAPAGALLDCFASLAMTRASLRDDFISSGAVSSLTAFPTR